jgi:hypothetical protein
MILKTYLDKVNTIVEESEINTGLNPISELMYGANITRTLIHFDVSNIKKELDRNGVIDYSKVKHILKITNCGIIDNKELYKTEDTMWGNGVKLHASSFDLIFFLIPQEWDEGKGYDYSLTNFQNVNINDLNYDMGKLIVTDGCNWYQAKNGSNWSENGVYDNQTLSKEYDKFAVKESEIIIARQHFDKGNENINVDISETVNKFLSEELQNYGIGIAFTPLTELIDTDDENYVGFFTNHTNTFFEPHLETTYEDTIIDDRNNFYLNKLNRLYLYCNIDGFYTNLDELPTCVINSSEMDVKQASEGIYYVELMLPSSEYIPNTMMYDVWSNLKYNGVILEDVEMDFVIKPSNHYFRIGNSVESNQKFLPLISGIKNDEKILRGDKRKIIVISKNEYSKNKSSIIKDLQYRLYVKSGKDEITVISYQNINQTCFENYFIIDTKMLVPQRYYIDVKYNYGVEEIYHNEVLSFEIINDKAKKYIE